jgi:hypothetical protein
MKLLGITISRQSILPLWEAVVGNLVNTSPDQIDLCFDGGSSIASSDEEDLGIEEDSEGTAFQLRDISNEKQEAKQRVRDLLRKAVDARMAADVALEHFFEEYDLSEDESDFSDDEV